MATAQNGKDVIYVDVDDEITTIIDKVTSAHARIVALVLPKRATVFQSIVNMKLLKHRADEAKKHLVLITSESGLMPLAGAVGVHVAQTLQSKPEIPAEPLAPSNLPEDVDENEAVSLPAEDFDADKAANKPVGDLARGATGTGMGASSQMPEETLELDNTDLADAADVGGPRSANVAAMAAGGGAGKSGGKHGKKGKKDGKLKVPNFEKFRLKLVLAVLAVVVLIVGWVLANNILPKASVIVTTDTSSVNSSLTPTLDTSATSVDTDKQVVPAKVEQVQKNYSQQVSATGQQNTGNKATGTVTLTAKACAPSLGTPDAVPAGSAITTNNLTFITQQNATFSFNGFSGGSCASYVSSDITITAQTGGAQYNVGDGTAFTVVGRPDVTGSGSTSGGTDSIQTVVQQSDIDSAKGKAEAAIDKNAIKSQLEQALQGDGEVPIPDSFTAGTPKVTASAKVGDQTSTVTVSEAITYTMFGAKKNDLHQLVAASVDQQIDTSKQAIQDDGLGSATITVPNPGTATQVQLSMQVTSVIGPHLDIAALKKAIVGEKAGDVQSTIKQNPGVEQVSVNFSPFWVSHVPKNTAKTTIVLKKSSSHNGNSN